MNLEPSVEVACCWFRYTYLIVSSGAAVDTAVCCIRGLDLQGLIGMIGSKTAMSYRFYRGVLFPHSIMFAQAQ